MLAISDFGSPAWCCETGGCEQSALALYTEQTLSLTSMSLPPNSTTTLPQRPKRVRWLFFALWANLSQAAVVVTVEPVSSDARLGLQLPMLLMSALLVIRAQQGFHLARTGYSLLALAYAALNLAPSTLSWCTGLSASVTTISAAASWMPAMSQWLHQNERWRQELPPDSRLRYARQGLIYGAGWIIVSAVSLVLTDWFNAPAPIEAAMFSFGCLSGWTLLGGYLAQLILQAPGVERD